MKKNNGEHFNMRLYLKVCEVRRSRGLCVDDMCEKMTKNCVDSPLDEEFNLLKLTNYIKNKNKQK
jgi:hypothetical protein